jgi:hypothetical protein
MVLYIYIKLSVSWTQKDAWLYVIKICSFWQWYINIAIQIVYISINTAFQIL